MRDVSNDSCADWLNSTPAETKVEQFGLSERLIQKVKRPTVSQRIFDNNFSKCGPIFKILLPGDS